MTTPSTPTSERLQVSPEVAQILSPQTPDAQKLKAIKGLLSLSPIDRVHVQMVLFAQGSESLKSAALEALRSNSNSALRSVLESTAHHPRVYDFIARARLNDLGTLILLRSNLAVSDATWIYVFSHCSYEVLSYFCDDTFLRCFPAEVCAAVAENPQASEAMKKLVTNQPAHDEESVSETQPESEPTVASDAVDDNDAPEESDDASWDEDLDDEVDYSDDYDEMQTATKQQMVLELDISEKIKLAMTGDKEWRTILIKESNKLVCGAVLKNPRITEGEVLFLAQNRSTQEELIRIILLNREWLKNYAIRCALVSHPRTPLPKALRFLSTLNEKDVRVLAKSRNVSSAIVNASRRMLAAKQRH